jgi:hypothetical protein
MGSTDAALAYLSNSVMEEARADQDAKGKSLYQKTKQDDKYHDYSDILTK